MSIIQTERDLVPHHTLYCEHYKSTIVFVYNTVRKEEMAYVYMSGSGRFRAIYCDDCHRDPQKQMQPHQVVMVTTSAGHKRAIVITIDDDGRLQRMSFNDAESRFVPMEPAPIRNQGIYVTPTPPQFFADMNKYLAKFQRNLMEGRTIPNSSIPVNPDFESKEKNDEMTDDDLSIIGDIEDIELEDFEMVN